LSRLRLTEELEALRGAHTAAVPSLTTLTRREHEIAGDVADGLANKHIARRRGVSVHTVENHLRSIFRKTGVDSRTKLALATGVDGSYPIDRRVVDFDHGARPHATTSLAESAAGRHRTTEPLVPSM
jgi:DNA-binding CsgD family transcriptional regulator